MPIHVLICDDSSFARKQIARALPQDWNIEVHHASNGREGLEAIRQGKGDVVLLDLTMPTLDGYGVLENIQKEQLNTKVIVISGDIQAEARDLVKKLGAVGFIKKPIDSKALRQSLIEFGVLEASQ